MKNLRYWWAVIFFNRQSSMRRLTLIVTVGVGGTVEAILTIPDDSLPRPMPSAFIETDWKDKQIFFQFQNTNNYSTVNTLWEIQMTSSKNTWDVWVIYLLWGRGWKSVLRINLKKIIRAYSTFTKSSQKQILSWIHCLKEDRSNKRKTPQMKNTVIST